LTPAQRRTAITELRQLRLEYPKLDMLEAVIRELEYPPQDPGDCIFARTAEINSADLDTRITPCQLGGGPDCTQCGYIASMGLAATAIIVLQELLLQGISFWHRIVLGSSGEAFNESFHVSLSFAKSVRSISSRRMLPRVTRIPGSPAYPIAMRQDESLGDLTQFPGTKAVGSGRSWD
jgi:hypothetical protein